MSDDSVFDLGLGGSEPTEDEPKAPVKKKRRRKTTKKKRTTTKKATSRPVSPDLSELDTDGSGTLDAKELLQGHKMPKPAAKPVATPVAEPVVEPVVERPVALGTPPITPDTLPRRETRIASAKRKKPYVARWDEFLSGLSRGTMEALYEMGISGLEEGKRSLTKFTRAALLKPNGTMLSQMVDEIEREMVKFGLALKSPPVYRPVAGGPIAKGTKLPKLAISGQTRQNREMRRRNLRSTM